MKKTIYVLMVVSFVVGLAAITAVKAQEQGQNQEGDQNASTIGETDGLEKIHSPEEIKDFRVMKNINGALFGIRIATTTAGGIIITPVGTSTLEKIGHPALINLYERIKRIGNALWGYKKPESGDGESNDGANANLVVAPEISACVATAINTKDTALMSRVTAAATELNAAIAARSACQQAAVVASSTPRATLNACVKTFNDAQKTIKASSKTVQQESWTIYRDSLKACASSTSAVPMVEDGGNIFE